MAWRGTVQISGGDEKRQWYYWVEGARDNVWGLAWSGNQQQVQLYAGEEQAAARFRSSPARGGGKRVGSRAKRVLVVYQKHLELSGWRRKTNGNSNLCGLSRTESGMTGCSGEWSGWEIFCSAIYTKHIFSSRDVSWWAVFETKYEGVSPAAVGRERWKIQGTRNQAFLKKRKEQRGEKCAGNNEKTSVLRGSFGK